MCLLAESVGQRPRFVDWSPPGRPPESDARADHRSEIAEPPPAEQFVDKGLDPLSDVITDTADRVERLPGGVSQFPIAVADPWEIRAGVTAAHGNDNVTYLNVIGGEHRRGGWW